MKASNSKILELLRQKSLREKKEANFISVYNFWVENGWLNCLALCGTGELIGKTKGKTNFLKSENRLELVIGYFFLSLYLLVAIFFMYKTLISAKFLPKKIRIVSKKIVEIDQKIFEELNN